ncbi:MAG TPA: winged helix DNA-binding domain-containing protein [Gemmatimonadaceae bacterium]|nr:winged helix DNA-binding domain-containing protein [Gemmatimonadaceae bacterium]
MRLTDSRIARQRLRSQHLVAPAFTDPVDVVRSLGAVQSQDYPNAKWAIAQRGRGIRDGDVERAVSTGALIRTHILRPTWHFVAAEDVRWMLALTAPRVSAAMASYNRKLALDAKVFRKSNAAITRVLRDGKELTRAELAKVLSRAGVKVSTGQRVAHLLMQAELDGVICSGPRRGKQITYMLLDLRVPPARAWDRDEALLELTRRYFDTRGPATLRDFSWWSGLTTGDAKRGIEAAGAALHRETRDGRPYWHDPATQASSRATRTAHLLPNYDEYFVGFRDRSAIGERLRKSLSNPRVDALMGHVLVVDGQIVGGWRRTLAKRAEIEFEMLVPITATERKRVTATAERFGRFLGLSVNVREVWS